MDQVFLFTFNGVLILFKRSKTQSRIDKKTKTVHRGVDRGASDNFPAKN